MRLKGRKRGQVIQSHFLINIVTDPLGKKTSNIRKRVLIYGMSFIGCPWLRIIYENASRIYETQLTENVT